VADNKTMHFIPPISPKREKRVGIYCRVSTNSVDQLKSLTAQVSALTRLTAANPKWLLVDVYIDIASSKTGSSRREFSRMLQDCKSRDIAIILTKSISRFGRDTVEILDALNQLKVLGIVSELERLGIESPTGKGKWCKRTIDVMLSNEKHMGNVRLLDNGKHEAYYRAEGNNPAIISKETFQAVKIENSLI